MLSLYFNCFITEDKKNDLSYGDRGFFYPVTYPRPFLSGSMSQFDILIKVIESYSVIEFDVAVFNLDIPFSTDKIRRQIEELIIENITYKKLYLSFKRPSTVSDWAGDIENYKNIFKKESPLLVVMNHDHPFVDYTASSFECVVENVFPPLEENFGKVLCYSHAPEFVSNAMNDVDFFQISPCLYKKDHINNWVDSLCIMTSETLIHIWKRLIYDGEYIGRFDWPGSSFNSLDLTMYIHTREYFRHYDNYGHVTGMRLFSEFQANTKYPINTPVFIDKNDMVDFYYQKWIDCFLLSIRDHMINQRFNLKPIKKVLIEVVRKTIVHFKISYLESDVKNKIITEEDLFFLESAVSNKIYYKLNSTFNEILIDVKLLQIGKVKNSVLLCINIFKLNFIIKIIKKWIR